MAKKTMGQLADEHWKLELKVRALKEQIKDLEHAQGILEMEAIELSEELFSRSSSRTCQGKLAGGEVKIEEHVNLKNPKALNDWILKTGHFEIYQARVSSTGYRELLAAGKKPPGLGIFKKSVFKTKALKGKKE